MNTIIRIEKFIMITASLMILTLFTMSGYAYALITDKSDRVSQGQSQVFSPGYINAAKQKTESIINQSEKKEGFWQNLVDRVSGKISDKVVEDSHKEVSPELKMKKTARSDVTTSQAASAGEEAINTDYNYDVVRGTGTDQVFQGERLMSEVINGTRHVYVGFSNAGTSTIQDGINRAAAAGGGIVVIRGGSYAGFNMANGVKVYGGYNEDGVRNITGSQTIINGLISAWNINTPSEINGITRNSGLGDGPPGGNSSLGMYIRDSSGLTILNSTISGRQGIFSMNSSYTIINSNFNTGHGAIYAYGGGANKTHITFIGNSISAGEGIWAYGVTLTTDKNTFYGSSGITSRDSTVIATNNTMELRNGFNVYNTNLSVSNNQFGAQYQGGTLYTLDNKSTMSNIATPSSSSLTNPNLNNLRVTSDYERSIFNALTDKGTNLNIALGDKSRTGMSGKELGALFASLLGAKGEAKLGEGGQTDLSMLAQLVENSMKQSALSIPLELADDIKSQNMQAALMLANILNNPTADQKAMLDTAMSLLNDVKSLEGDTGSPELKKASDDLLQMVAAVLVAQAIPDLLKEGDVANIKGIFSDLNSAKGNLMNDYQAATRPYYEEVAKDMAKNLSALQANNILSDSITHEELENLPPSEIDKMLEKIRKLEKKSFEEEYILQQETKYRKQYLEPNKKVFEERIKAMMKEFTKELSRALEVAGVAKK